LHEGWWLKLIIPSSRLPTRVFEVSDNPPEARSGTSVVSGFSNYSPGDVISGHKPTCRRCGGDPNAQLQLQLIGDAFLTAGRNL
jgi:hypothetical protein